MKARIARVTAAAALAMSVVAAAQANGQEANAQEAEVRAVVEGFKAALAAGDSTAALGYLHRDLMVYEEGHAESLTEYRSGHLAADMEFSAGVETTPLQQGVHEARPSRVLPCLVHRLHERVRQREAVDAEPV